jgi:hypothetical protein
MVIVDVDVESEDVDVDSASRVAVEVAIDAKSARRNVMRGPECATSDQK